MICESRITGIEFDQFWYESVKEGVAYFFRWLGTPRSTVLVIYDYESLDHLECRTLGDSLVPRLEAEPIIAEVVKQYQKAGFWKNPPVIDEKVYPIDYDEDDSIYDNLYRCCNKTAFPTSNRRSMQPLYCMRNGRVWKGH